MTDTIYFTYSLCPVCFREIIAEVAEIDGRIYMVKECPDHGRYKTLIWEADKEHYIRWLSYGGLESGSLPQTPDVLELEKRHHYHCTSRPDNVRPACSAALMVTNRCNLDCPVCFTKPAGGEHRKPDIEDLKSLLSYYRDRAGEGAPVEFCGGEPTTRKDLDVLARFARSIGFDYIQLNTNGIRLAETDYCSLLKESGITTIYLGFDGNDDKIYRYKYGRDLLETKLRAIDNCKKADLAVVLVPCIIPGVNDDRIGEIVQYAKNNMPTVKGIYFQPISYFGKYPDSDRTRITIPKLLGQIEIQTEGEVRADSFLPGNFEHPQCSFQGIFNLNKEKKLQALTKSEKRILSEDNYIRIRKNTKFLWRDNNKGFLSIGGMAFQDIWNYDSLRTGRCPIQIICRDKRLIPLCTKYLTNSAGQKLYSGID